MTHLQIFIAVVIVGYYYGNYLIFGLLLILIVAFTQKFFKKSIEEISSSISKKIDDFDSIFFNYSFI